MSRHPFRIHPIPVLLSLACQLAFAETELHWAFQPVDTCYGASSVAVDTSGTIKVAYKGAGKVKLASWLDGRWQTEVADTGIGGDAQLSMDLDPEGYPHIVFHNSGYSHANYTRKDKSGWKRMLSVPLHIVNLDFYQNSIRVNSSGDAYLGFPIEDNGWPAISLTKVAKNGDTTGPTVLDHGNGKWHSMVLDSLENPMIAFYRTSSSGGTQVGLASREGDAWKVTLPDSGNYPTEPGPYTNLVRESDGTLHISYLNKVNNKGWIYLATRKPGGDWIQAPVDSLPVYTIFSCRNSLKVDSKGRLYLAYPLFKMDADFKVETSKLVLAYKDKADSTWVKTIIDSTDAAGEFVSLTLSREETPVLTYLHSKKNMLWSAISSYAPIYVNGVKKAKPAFKRSGPKLEKYRLNGQMILDNPEVKNLKRIHTPSTSGLLRK